MSLSGYVSMLRDSLNKKNRILDEIIEENIRQKELLLDSECTPEQLQSTIDSKEELINQINELDEGFDEVYKRVEEALSKDRSTYKEDIIKMKELIRLITDKSTRVQSQEEENYRLARDKFTYIKEQIQKISKGTQATNVYYKQMLRVNYVDPQFMDNKK